LCCWSHKLLFTCLQHFEAILKRNGGTVEAPGFLVGPTRTAADLAVYHFLAAAQQHYRQYYDSIEAPLCKAFQQAIAERPNIKAYLSSSRCQPWDADSMM
jgi:glutathione S-transferase